MSTKHALQEITVALEIADDVVVLQERNAAMAKTSKSAKRIAVVGIPNWPVHQINFVIEVPLHARLVCV